MLFLCLMPMCFGRISFCAWADITCLMSVNICLPLTPCLYGFVRICVFLPDMTHTMSQFLLPVPPRSNIQWRKSVAPPFLVKVGLYLYMSVTNQKITNLIWNKYRLLIDQVFPHNITRTNLSPNSYSIIDRPMGKSWSKGDIVHTWSVWDIILIIRLLL